MPKPMFGRMALGALISLSFRPEVPAGGIRREPKNLNLFRDIQPANTQPFPLPCNLPQGISGHQVKFQQVGATIRRQMGHPCFGLDTGHRPGQRLVEEYVPSEVRRGVT